MDVIRKTFAFINRYRARLAIAAIFAIVAAVYYNYYHAPKLLTEGVTPNERKKKSVVALRSSKNKTGLKARLLVRIRKQFDISCRIFLPTLRKSIFDLVDITQSVRQIKALRSSPVSDTQDAEARLWEDVKVSSFTLLFISAYVLSALTTVLRTQLHVLARSLFLEDSSSLLQGLNDPSVAGSDFPEESVMLRVLIEGTFKQLFGTGLHTFADMVRSRIQDLLRTWTVKEKVRVELDDMLLLVQSMRADLERDFDPFLRTLFIGDENQAIPGTDVEAEKVRKLLYQIWDVVESPIFSVVYFESVDATFRVVAENLRRFVFQSEHSPGPFVSGSVHNSPAPRSASATPQSLSNASTPFPASSAQVGLKTPPLASILPQLKSLAAKLLPESAETVNIYDIRAISTGPLLESFCMTIFDAEEEPMDGHIHTNSSSATNPSPLRAVSSVGTS